MRPYRSNFRRRRGVGRKDEGVIIILVAIFLLFVVGAMAALSIDVTTFYTARSEAQIIADSAALTAARVLANSGMTSSTDSTLATNAKNLAINVATQVAQQNRIGGAAATTVNVTFPDCGVQPAQNNPCVKVTVARTDLPTFFARIWGTTHVSVSASATAEAYNPSPQTGSATVPVAPICVKPWLLPNLDPTQGVAGPQIFDPATGNITDRNLLGQSWPNFKLPNPNGNGLRSRNTGFPPAPGRYYPVRIDASFPAPTQALPTCSAGFTDFQLSIAGCVTQPIACGTNAMLKVDKAVYVSKWGSRNIDTVGAAECLIHYNSAAGDSDSVDTTSPPVPPFQFLAGNENPVAGAVGKDMAVSDSLVSVPVYDSDNNAPPNSVNVIGFLQLFINPQSGVLPPPGQPVTNNLLPVTIINMVGCGNSTTGTAVVGNGPSTVAVRLVATSQ